MSPPSCPGLGLLSAKTDPYLPCVIQELPWRVIGPRIDRDSFGHSVHGLSYLGCRPGIWLG